MAALLVFLALLVVLGAAVLLGRTPDTRDPEFGLGRLIDPRRAHEGR